MNRVLIVAMLVLGLVSTSGCANGPVRSWLRGARCNTPLNSACGTSESSAFYTPDSGSCSSCGAPVTYGGSYDGGIIVQQPPFPNSLPAPGPGTDQ